MIRKEGKARWVYSCSLCGVDTVAPDQLRILEARNKHVRGNITHFGNTFAEIFRPLVELFQEFAPTAKQKQALGLLPPPNLPRDPSLLKDRRKWGGQ